MILVPVLAVLEARYVLMDLASAPAAKRNATVHASALPNAAADAQVVTPVKMEYAKKSVLLLPVQLQYFVLQPVAVKYILLRQTAVQIPFVLTANQLQTKMKNASPLQNNGVLLMVLLT